MLTKIEVFLLKKRGVKEAILVSIKLFLGYILYMFLTGAVISVFFPSMLPEGDKLAKSILDVFTKYGWTILIIGIFFLATLEEILFRWPISIYLRRKISFEWKFIITILLSVVFVTSHFANSTDMKFLFPFLAQGAFGLILSIIYIINGANNDQKWRGLLTSVVFHFVWNAVLILPSIYFTM